MSTVEDRVKQNLINRAERIKEIRKSLNNDLTEIERSTIACKALGMTTKKCAAALDRSEKTIKNHIFRTFLKLDAECSTTAVLHAIRLGIIPLDEIGLRALVSDKPPNEWGGTQRERSARFKKNNLKRQENARRMDDPSRSEIDGGCAP